MRISRFSPIVFIWLFSVLCPISVLAQYGGGSGTAADPYLIYTAEQFYQLVLQENDWDKHFALMADIDVSGFFGTDPDLIGDSQPFTGSFDGRGHTISGFTYLAAENYIGLFSWVSGPSAQIKNLGLISPSVGIGLGIVVAALVGTLEDGKVENCWVADGSVNGFSVVGSLVGDNYGGTISNCYSTASVSASSIVAGLVGSNTSGLMQTSYFAGSVSVAENDVGGIVGWDDQGLYVASLWDQSLNPLITGVGNIEPDPAGVIAASTGQMQTGQTFVQAGWDIVTADNQPRCNIWRLCEDGNYPRLAVEYKRSDFACPDGIDGFDLGIFADYWLTDKLDVDIDFYFDGRIDFLDFASFAAVWLSQQGSVDYDARFDVAPAGGDGQIDEQDLALFVDYWLAKGRYHLKADIEPYDGDDKVDNRDFAAFAADWLAED